MKIMCCITYQGLVLFDQKRKREGLKGVKEGVPWPSAGWDAVLPLQAAQAPPLVRKPGRCVRWARPKPDRCMHKRRKEKKGERETVENGRQQFKEEIILQ